MKVPMNKTVLCIDAIQDLEHKARIERANINHPCHTCPVCYEYAKHEENLKKSINID